MGGGGGDWVFLLLAMTSDDRHGSSFGGLVGLFLNSVDRVHPEVGYLLSPLTGSLAELRLTGLQLGWLASQPATTILPSLNHSAGVTGMCVRWRLEIRSHVLLLEQQALLPTESAFVFCFWVLIVTVGV